MFLPIKRWHAAALLSLLVACGGGGGGGSPAPGAPPQPGEPAPTGTLAVLAGDTGTGGYADGAGRLARFNLPSAIAVDAAGDVFVADTFNLAIRKVTPQGVVTTPYRNAGRVRDLVFAPGGDLYFTANDEQFAAVYRATPSGQVTAVVEAGVIRGAWSIAAGADGTLYVSSPAGIHRFKPGAAPALMATPPRLLRQLVVDGAGNVYGSMVTEDAVAQGVWPVITQPARSAVIVQVRPDGTWSPYAGSAQDPGYADGPRAQARFSNADGLALDTAGRLWVADSHVEGRQSGMMRRLSAEGVVSSPFGTRVLFKHGLSADLAFDREGTLYALTGNGIAKIGASGDLTPLAGSAMPQPQDQAPIRALQLAVSAGNDIYAAEPEGTQVKVRKFDANGRRVAFGTDGQGVEVPGLDPQDIATLNTLSMVVDGGGNLHLAFARIQQTPTGADGFTSRGVGGAILRITSQGQLNTVRSSETFGPTDRFAPSGIAVNAQGEYRYLDLVDGKLHRRTASGEPTGTPLDLRIPVTTHQARMARFVGDREDHGWVIDDSGGKLMRVAPTSPFLLDLAGASGFERIIDGPGAQARFAVIRDGVADARGNLLVTDHTTLRRVAGDGAVTTVAGTPREFGATDDLVAGPLPGLLGSPRALAVGPDGAIYLNSHGALVRVRLQ